MDQEILQAAAVLRQGGLVAYPTETYYGLAVDPFNVDALVKLFRVKQRSQLKPVLLLIGDNGQLDGLVQSVSSRHHNLMEVFWPGPLTLVFPAKTTLPKLVTGLTGTVGVRRSPHPVAEKLLTAFGGPITSTSANVSGLPPAVSAAEVRSAFGRQLDLILDGGATPGGKGSTLVSYEGDELRCLREGCIPFVQIQQAIVP